MVSVLLISHGILADGMKETAKVFFGPEIAGFDSLCLETTETAESYREKLIAKVDEMDQGEGVVIVCDLLGGTPCNQCVFLDQTKVKVITGMSLPMVMELLAMRDPEMNLDDFVENIKGSIVNFSRMLEEKKAKKRERRKASAE